MSKVITRPKSGKTKAAMAAPVTQQAPVCIGDQLAIQAAENLQDIVIATIYNDEGETRELHNTHFSVVDRVLGLLLAPEFHERSETDPERDDVVAHLAVIASELSSAVDVMLEREITGVTLPMQVALSSSALQAANYAARLHSAYAGLPATLEDLHELTTFAGMRPFRERPQPPIRRVEAESTPANELNRKQLVRVLEHVATSISLMDDLLMQAVQMEGIPREVLNLISWAEFMARQIGAAADQATGSWIVGGLNEWNCGSDFAQLGKVGAA